MTRIGIVDTTLRDGQQCLWATRMTTPMILPIAERLDRAGFDAVEVASAVQFDSCVRYLGENPWLRLRLLAERMSRTPLQALLRSRCVLGFDSVADDLTALWAERLVANGIRRFVAFDGLHDLGNLSAAIRHARALGAHVTGWLVFSLSPVHTDELYVRKAREFIDDVGIDALMIEDASGILTPERAATLVPALRAAIGSLPLGLHSHGLIGLPQRTYLEAARHGVDHVYTCIPPLADSNAPPNAITTIRNLRASGFAVGVDNGLVAEIAAHFDRVADLTGKPKGAPQDFDAAFLDHQIPGGVLSNLRAQLEAAGLGHKLDAIVAETARVRVELGYPIQVTPFAQHLAVQATLNIVQGERYATVPLEVKKYALGHYGRLVSPIDPDVLDRIIERGPKSVALTPPVLEPMVPKLRRTYPHANDDERLLRYFFDDALVERALSSRPDPDEFALGERPVLHLLKELARRSHPLSVTVEKGGEKLHLSGRAALT